MRTLEKLPNDVRVKVDASRTRSVHPDIIEILEDFKKNAPTRGIEFELIGLNLSQTDPVEEFGRVVINRQGQGAEKRDEILINN